MSKGESLAKNTFILFVGTFFLKATQYLLLPLYTVFLSTAEYGEVELVNTFVSLLVPIVGLQIDQGVFRFLIDSRKNETGSDRLISTSLAFVVVSSLFFSGAMGIINIFIKYEFMWLLILNMVFSGLSSLVMQITRGLGSNKDYSLANIITAIITAMFNILFVLSFKMGANGMLYGTAIGYAVGIIYLFMRLDIFKYLSIRNIDKKSFRKLVKYSLPMVPNSLSWWVFSSSDRVVVSNFINVSATGILSVAYKFSTIGLLVFNVFNMSLTESISLNIEEDDVGDYYNKVFNVISQIFTSIGGILIAAMPFIFGLLVSEDFNEAYNLIPIAIAATTLQVYAGILGVMYIAKGNTNSIAVTSIIAAVINIVTDIAMIDYIGIFAAVVSTVLSFLALVAYRLIDISKKYVKIKMDYKLVINFILCFGVILGLFYVNNLYSNIINIGLAFGLFVLFNKNNIGFLLRMIKSKKEK